MEAIMTFWIPIVSAYSASITSSHSSILIFGGRGGGIPLSLTVHLSWVELTPAQALRVDIWPQAIRTSNPLGPSEELKDGPLPPALGVLNWKEGSWELWAAILPPGGESQPENKANREENRAEGWREIPDMHEPLDQAVPEDSYQI